MVLKSIIISMQVHDIEFSPTLDIIINETLPALQQLKDTGKIKHIGITGYPLHIFRYAKMYLLVVILIYKYSI